MKTLKRTWADISLDNLEYNYRSIRAHLPSGTRFLGVMKADAYGHGAVPVSRALADLGAEYLAVSNLEEAVQIRRGEVRLPILILGYTPPEYAANMIFLDITQEVHSLAYAQELNEALRVHSHAAARRVKLEGGANDLIDRIAADPLFPLSREEIVSQLDPALYNGRSVSQVEELFTTMPAFCRPMNAMNRPIPAEIAVLTAAGIASKIILRRPVTVSRTKTMPSTRTRTSAFA